MDLSVLLRWAIAYGAASIALALFVGAVCALPGREASDLTTYTYGEEVA